MTAGLPPTDDAAVPSPIALTLPSDPNVSRIVRLTASAIASLAGCTMDELQNVKIAVSEAIIVLVEHGDGRPIELIFDVERGRFRVTARSPIAEFDPKHPSLALCRVVLEDVTRQYSIDWGDGVASIGLDVALTSSD
jgi:anti-sigma regulatory factor (Ser/Thr protein kinase)